MSSSWGNDMSVDMVVANKYAVVHMEPEREPFLGTTILLKLPTWRFVPKCRGVRQLRSPARLRVKNFPATLHAALRRADSGGWCLRFIKGLRLRAWLGVHKNQTSLWFGECSSVLAG